VSEIAAEQAPVDRQVDAARLLEDCGAVLTEQVSEAQQEVFRLRYADGQSMKQIAATLGKSCQAVKISLFRTRRTLSAELERRGIAIPA
jgi:RNA polymerase sigma factor (sigma-70 family)